MVLVCPVPSPVCGAGLGRPLFGFLSSALPILLVRPFCRLLATGCYTTHRWAILRRHPSPAPPPAMAAVLPPEKTPRVKAPPRLQPRVEAPPRSAQIPLSWGVLAGIPLPANNMSF